MYRRIFYLSSRIKNLSRQIKNLTKHIFIALQLSQKKIKSENHLPSITNLI